jgi:hypothetical protein
MPESGALLNPSTARMRLLRERAKSGIVIVTFEIDPAAVIRLIELGWLKPEDRHSSIAVTEAFVKFGGQALLQKSKASA